MDKIRLGVIYGGKSGEHEVSIMSADSVIAAVDPEKYEVVRIFISKEGWWTIAGQPLNPWDLRSYIDFALPILHGPNGEDGILSRSRSSRSPKVHSSSRLPISSAPFAKYGP